MKNIDEQYLDLLRDILENGVSKGDRTGTGTISVFGRQIRHKMSNGFPALTTKKLAWKQVYTELQWFLKGETNIQPLVKQGNNIWVGDAYKRYYDEWLSRKNNEWHLSKEEFIEQIKTNDEFAKKWGELGPVYGKQWRDWKSIDYSEMRITTYGIDQIANVIETLKTNPDSRRMIVSAWNVGELDEMTLPPCHNFFQFYTRELSLEERLELIQPYGMDALKPEAREKWLEENNIPTRAISLMWNQRSVDVPLGLPFNIASYALLLEMVALHVNMVPDELIGNLGDTHIYQNQVDGVKEQLTREPKQLPKLMLNPLVMTELEHGDFDEALTKPFEPELLEYDPHPTIKFPLSN